MPQSRGGPAQASARPSSLRGLSLGATCLVVGFAAGAITVPLALRRPTEAPAEATAAPSAASTEPAPETAAAVSAPPLELAALKAENDDLKRKIGSLESLLALYQRSRTAPPPAGETQPTPAPERRVPPAPPASQPAAAGESSMDRERRRLAAYETRIAALAELSREVQAKNTLMSTVCSGSSVARGGRGEFQLAGNQDSPGCKEAARAAEEAQRRLSEGTERLRDEARRDGILPGLLDEALARAGL